MNYWRKLILRLFLVASFVILSVSFLAKKAHAQCAYSMPPQEAGDAYITSPDGHVTIGVSKRYGGGIVYLKDDRLPANTPDFGNIIDYGQGGALFTTPIWHFPWNLTERQMCWLNQDVRSKSGNAPLKNNELYNQMYVLKIPEWQDTSLSCTAANLDNDDSCYCGGSLSAHNPTQGGFVAEGCLGNINPTTVALSNNVINVSSREVNFNFGFNPSPGDYLTNPTYVNQWQTDFWQDISIYFHPVLPDVVVVDTKITYCKDNGANCAGKFAITQDNQLSTLFAAGSQNPDPNFRGPFGRAAYRSPSGNQIKTFDATLNWYLGIPLYYSAYANLPEQYKNLGYNIENWGALLYSFSDQGVGISVDKYLGIPPVEPITTDGRPGSYLAFSWPSLQANQPQLDLFSQSGITRINTGGSYGAGPFWGNWIPIGTNEGIVRYKFAPGAWYSFRTFVATGNLKDNDPQGQDLRWKLVRAQDSNFWYPQTPIRNEIFGYVDSLSCTYNGGWVHDSRTSDPINVRLDIYPDQEPQSKFSLTTPANNVRSDLVGACPPNGACAYGLTIGTLPGNFAGKMLRADIYGVTADGQNRIYHTLSNVIGPCTNVGNTSPTPSPTAFPTPTPSPSYSSQDLKNLFFNYLTSADRSFRPKDEKVNLLDGGYVIHWLQ